MELGLRRPMALSFLTLSILLSAGCKTPEKSIPSTLKGLIVAENLRWPDNRAEICWKTPGYAREKLLIKTALETEYNEKTNFRFFGFYDCGANLKDKLVVEFDPAVHPDANTGFGEKNLVRMFVQPFSDKFPGCKKSAELADVCLRNVSLHEFGHAAGLVHEQDRKDSTCDEHKGNPDASVRLVGNFDSESIMNACNPQYFTEKLSLSAGDIISINTLYPEEPEAKIAEKQPRIDGCQRCGQDHPDKRYCGIVDPKSGSWQSGTWVPCLNEEKIMNRCQPCGKDKINERFCGQYDGKTWSAGTWVLCTGNNSVPAVAEPVN